MRILVVEDDAHLRKLCVFALSLDPELQVDTCATGELALEAIAAKRPDLVLLDLEMPGMGGRETAKQIDPSIAIVIMTGLERLDVSDLPVRGVIKKPFDPLTLAAELRQLR